MNKFLTTAAQSVRKVFVVDTPTKRFLDKTYVEVSLNSRLWNV